MPVGIFLWYSVVIDDMESVARVAKINILKTVQCEECVSRGVKVIVGRFVLSVCYALHDYM